MLQQKHLSTISKDQTIKDTQYLHTLIAEGEHQQQDFKFIISDARKIARSLSAFANTDGGRLLIGVKDNRNIAGIRNEEEIYMIEAAATHYCTPKIEFEARPHSIEGRQVLEIIVPPSKDRPVYAIDEEKKAWAYVRVHDENILASPVHLRAWKGKTRAIGELITLSSTEQLLMTKLQTHEPVNLNKFYKEAQISRHTALKLFAQFVQLGIMKPYYHKMQWLYIQE
ncbi:MAG TPA: ATP-binding protein [Bacteroidaceae bacterium]|nr:ATP-binding protein [Bacteroidaceae bacterium]